MEIYEEIYLINILFFLFSITILSYTLILPLSQLQTQLLITSQTVTHRVFKTNMQYSYAHFILKIDEKCSLTDVFI